MTPKIRRFKNGDPVPDELFDNEPTSKAIAEIDKMTDEEFEAELEDIGLDLPPPKDANSRLIKKPGHHEPGIEPDVIVVDKNSAAYKKAQGKDITEDEG